MLGKIVIAAMLVAGATATANAACPSTVTGTAAETIKANELRIICLQQEAAAAATQQKYQMDLNAMQRSLDNLQLQQRLNSVQPYTLPQPYVAPPVVPRPL